MRVSLRFLFAVMIAVSLALFAGGITARAQVPPPCNSGTITIINNSTVPVGICLITVPAIPCTPVAAGATVMVPVANPTTLTGVSSFAGFNYAWQPNPLPPPPWWIPSIALPPAGTCFNVTYDPPTCTVTITMAPGPPCLRP